MANFTTSTKQIKAFSVNEDQGIFGGYAAVFGFVPFAAGPEGGVFLSPGAFKRTLNNAKKPFKVLWNHDRNKPIGKTLSTIENDIGLRFEAQLNMELPLAQEVFSNIKHGVVDEMSIGFDMTRKRMDNDALIIQEVRLTEISPVSDPANPAAEIDMVMSRYPKAFDEIKELIEKQEHGADYIMPRIYQLFNAALSTYAPSNDTQVEDSLESVAPPGSHPTDTQNELHKLIASVLNEHKRKEIDNLVERSRRIKGF